MITPLVDKLPFNEWQVHDTKTLGITIFGQWMIFLPPRSGNNEEFFWAITTADWRIP